MIYTPMLSPKNFREGKHLTVAYIHFQLGVNQGSAEHYGKSSYTGTFTFPKSRL